ncbi:MAG: hypothetical protein K9F97_06025, partial [Candidatus Nanopelagicales bacterium]|nr:hypothetical protein [Candidatus Nanopelagicales bacterium]
MTKHTSHGGYRRKTLHTFLAVTLLTGTFTAIDQTVSSQLSPASADTGGESQTKFTTTAGGDDTTFGTAAAPAVPTTANTSVSSDGTKITMLFTTDLSTNIPPTEQFAVSIGTYAAPATPSVNVPIGSVTFTSPRTITLNLSQAIESDKGPRVTYTAPPVDNTLSNFAIQDTAGADGLGFTVSPTTQSLIPALIGSTPPTLQANGNTVVLTYNIDVATTMPSASAFTFKKNGSTAVPVTLVTRTTTRTVTLTLGEGIESGTPVTLSYTAPTVDNVSSTNLAIQGTAGNDALSFTDVTVSNTASLVPKLVSAAVPTTGDRITLTFSQSLLTTAGVIPPTSAFTVTRNGAPIAVSATPTVSGTTFTLVLPVQLYQEEVRVTYTPPTTYNSATSNIAIQATGGQDAAGFTDVLVTNGATLTTPVVQANGNTVVLTYNIDVATTMPSASAFTFKKNGSTVVPVTLVTRTSARIVTLTLEEGIESGTPVTLSYTAPTVDNVSSTNLAIQGTGGQDFQSFTDVTVTNTASNVPKLVSASIPASGNTIALTFSKTLVTTSLPDKSQFTVTYGGVPASIASVSAATTVLTLTLVGTVASDQPVLISYSPPSAWTSGTANVAIQDSTSGADALAFSGFAVGTNSSAVPYIVSTSTSTSGEYIYLNFNEDIDQTTIKTLSQFTVKINGSSATLSDSRVSGARQVYVRLSSPLIQRTDVVTLSYTPTSYSATLTPAAVLQDVGGADAPALVDFAITNSSTRDTRPPVLQSANVSTDGLSMQLTANEAITAFTTLSTGWQILVNGVARSVSSVTMPTAPVTSFTFNFTQANQIGAGATVTVGYTNNAYANKFMDTSNNQAATFSGFAAVNNSTADKTSPVLQSIGVPASGDRLILSYNEAMGGTLPAVNTTNFGVTVTGVAWLPTGISIDGSNIILTGPATLEAGKTVVLTKYTAPTSDALATNAAIQDQTGNDAVSLSNVAVTNNSILDITSPIWQSATTNAAGDQITLTFNEDISSDLAPLAGAFTISTSAGTAPTITSTSISGSTVVLSLSARVQNSATVSFGYTAPNGTLNNGLGNAAIQDLAGNDSATLTAKAVTNVSSYDTLGPVLTAQSVSTNGQTLTLTFNEAIGNIAAPITAFSVTAASAAVSVTGVAVSGNTVVLTLGSVIQISQTVSVSYVAPDVNSATSNTAVQDLIGNDALAFSNQVVTNSSTMDTVRPELGLVARPSLAANGTTLTPTSSEALAAPTASAG